MYSRGSALHFACMNDWPAPTWTSGHIGRSAGVDVIAALILSCAHYKSAFGPRSKTLCKILGDVRRDDANLRKFDP